MTLKSRVGRSDASLHINHRRKNYYKNPKRRWRTAISPYKQAYWTRERARERHLIAHERYDDCQNCHPKSVLWDAL